MDVDIEELKVEKIKILIIISDWLMPGICGDDLLIKVHHYFPQITKVLGAGHDFFDFRIQGIGLPFQIG